jgi:hypothetical protein
MSGGGLLLAWWVWASLGALYLPLPGAGWRVVVVLGVIGLPVAALAWRGMKRPAFGTLVVVCGIVTIWWGSLEPRNDRDWSPDQAVLPSADWQGDQVTVRNIRHSEYRAVDDYTARFYDATFDLGELESVWFFVEPFAGYPGAAHTFVSFGFRGDRYVAVSVEIRRERGEGFSALKGIFKHYELMYVVGDERDLVRLRTDFRNDDVYLYPVEASGERKREFFREVFEGVNRLRDEPEFYHSVWNTCTTRVVEHVNGLVPGRIPFRWGIVFPAEADRVAYELGLIADDLPFEALRERSRINEAAKTDGGSERFSRRIREHLAGGYP